MNTKLATYVKVVLRAIVSLSLIVWLALSIDWQQMIEVVQQSAPLYMLLAFLAIQLTVFSSVWKWQRLVRASYKEKNRDVGLWRLSKLYYIGLFFNNFLPSSVGGDVMRIYYLRRTIGTSKATASVAFERLTSGGALILILIVAAMLLEQARPFLTSIFILTAIFVSIFIALWFLMKKQQKQDQPVDPSTSKLQLGMNKIKNGCADIGNTMAEYQQQPIVWWGNVILLSFVFQIGMVWINDLLFRSFHIVIPWTELLVIITLISALTMLPVSINGIGVREVSYVFFFEKLGVPSEIAIFVSLLFFFLVTISSIIGGVFWLSERGVVKHEQLSESIS